METCGFSDGCASCSKTSSLLIKVTNRDHFAVEDNHRGEKSALCLQPRRKSICHKSYLSLCLKCQIHERS